MDYLPGFLQGLTRVLISHPFDYVKLYLQTNKSKSFADFLKKNKISSLYRGVTVPLITVPIDRAIQFRIYELLNERKISPFLSGSLCGCISVLITLPSSYIGNNYVLQKKENNLFNFTRKIIKTPLMLYNGFKPELLRSTLGTSIYLGTYGYMRNKYGSDLKQSIINGAFSGVTVWTITYPIETIKVEQQLNNRSIVDILTNRIKTYGILNMWKGISPIYIRTIPSSVMGMVVYEQAKQLIELNK